MESLYKRHQYLQAQGIQVRRANHFEEARDTEGNKLTWVVDLGGHRQARRAFRTCLEALTAAEEYVEAIESPSDDRP